MIVIFISAIQGSTRRDVSQAYHRISNKIIDARMKTDFTHFISFPVNSSNIQESFLKFKDEILKKYKGVCCLCNFNFLR